jgi:hypothetical protein
MSFHNAKNQLGENIKLLHSSVAQQANVDHLVLYNLSNALINIIAEMEKMDDKIERIGQKVFQK